LKNLAVLNSQQKRLDVWPSTLRKVIAGSKISSPTRSKLVSIIGEQVTDDRQSNHKFDSVISVIKETVRKPIDILEASSKFGVNPSTITKILDGKPLSYSVQEKLITAVESQLIDVEIRKPSNPPSMVERLNHVHRLYEDLGTLEAAGRVIGVTRERVRQLLVKGTRLGLFEYKPFEYPFVPKEKLIADYRRLFEFGPCCQSEWHYLWISWQVAYSLQKSDQAAI
jgi:predicted transcriptional regulator